MSDLIARLRDAEYYGYEVCKEAADALEAQARRIAELEEQLKDERYVSADTEEFAQNEKAENVLLCARIAELKAALKDCADELEAWIDETYKSSDGSVFSQCKFQYDRDIVTVRAARAAYLGEKG